MNLNFGFVILCPEPNINLLNTTVRSLKGYHSEKPFLAVVANNCVVSAQKEMKKVCTVYRAKDTITSMINTGFRHVDFDWALFVMAGTFVKARFENKYTTFIKQETDVLFPIVNGVYNWEHASLNGMCINKKLFKTVGPFGEKGELPDLKLEWGINAHLKGSEFKAILGVRL